MCAEKEKLKLVEPSTPDEVFGLHFRGKMEKKVNQSSLTTFPHAKLADEGSLRCCFAWGLC